MLTENVGTHMLDSGIGYGRHWERNQGVKFSTIPEATICASAGPHGGDIDVTVNVYPWLVERLEYAADLDAEFRKFADSDECSDMYWLEIMEKWISARGDADDTVTVNTYNGESALSQVLQYVYWTEEVYGRREEYVLLQIHGGCDVRGGYTAPRIFRVTDCTEFFDTSRAGIYCDNSECYSRWSSCSGGTSDWDTDDGCNRLDKYPFVSVEVDADAEDQDDPELGAPRKGVVFVKASDHACCPVCGTGRLQGSPR